jgi:hypothetical protein
VLKQATEAFRQVDETAKRSTETFTRLTAELAAYQARVEEEHQAVRTGLDAWIASAPPRHVREAVARRWYAIMEE